MIDRVEFFDLEKNPVIRNDLLVISNAELDWTQLAQKTVIVSGAGGFLGSYLVKSLLAANARFGLGLRIICVVRSMDSLRERLSDYLSLRELVACEQDLSYPLSNSFPAADMIIHAASQASPKQYGVDPVGTLMPNVAGTANLLEHGRKTGLERFLFVSSGSVYGQHAAETARFGESDFGYLDPTSVRSCYAESKRMAENMCVSWAHQYGIHASIVRPFHTYGPSVSLQDGRVFADFVADVVAGRNIILKSDGQARRAFCYVSDAILGLLTVLLTGEKAEAYNIGNPDAEISIGDLARTLAQLYPERKIEVQKGSHPTGSRYLRSPVSNSRPSITKAIGLGWAPRIGIVEGFRRAIESFEN